MGHFDSKYGFNPEDRKRVSIELITIGGSLVACHSKTHPIVTPSSTEAKYVAMATAAQELRYTQQLLGELTGITLTGWILEDNQGTIFLVKNAQVGGRTKHVNILHHYL